MTTHFNQADSLAHRITCIRDQLSDSIRIIAISKTVPATAIREAYAAGLRDFGESKVQEAAEKQQQLRDLPDITWHLVGHLQGNKAQKALDQFQWIHSLDSLKLAHRLNTLAQDRPAPPQICLQVKLRPDPSKYGFTVPELIKALPQLDGYPFLNICGLMAIPPKGLTPEDTRFYFQQAHELAHEIDGQSWTRIRMQQLSLGMSGDYPLAVSAGATMVRLGRILFGERPQ